MARKKAARATGRKAGKTARARTRSAAARKKSAKPLKKKAAGATTKARSLAKAASRRVKKATGKARKAVARASGTARKAAGKASSQARKTVKKASSQARKTVKKASNQVRKTAKKASSRARKTVTRTSARPATMSARRSASSRNPAARVVRKAVASVKAVTAGVTAAFSPAPPAPKPKRAPTLDRARKTVAEAERPHSDFPSSLDYDPHGSAARTGRQELTEKLHNHTSTSPALSAGDVDADWASAESSGDETPGGDNPTPDQDVVDEIGRALGIEYDDEEELQGGAEITERDHHRWELDPASKDDDEEKD